MGLAVIVKMLRIGTAKRNKWKGGIKIRFLIEKCFQFERTTCAELMNS